MASPIDLHSFDISRVTIEEPFELTKTGQKNKTRKCTVRYKGAPLVVQTADSISRQIGYERED